MAAAVRFHPATPIFRVEQLDASLEYYTQKLGFVLDWNHEGIVASVSRGPANIMLSVGDQGHRGCWAWIGVSDADALHTELERVGASIRTPPTNFSWALEFQVEDPDGNIIRFGSASVPGRPFGPWKDMHGKLW